MCWLLGEMARACFHSGMASPLASVVCKLQILSRLPCCYQLLFSLLHTQVITSRRGYSLTDIINRTSLNHISV